VRQCKLKPAPASPVKDEQWCPPMTEISPATIIIDRHDSRSTPVSIIKLPSYAILVVGDNLKAVMPHPSRSVSLSERLRTPPLYQDLNDFVQPSTPVQDLRQQQTSHQQLGQPRVGLASVLVTEAMILGFFAIVGSHRL
jgi:hypothetical protein